MIKINLEDIKGTEEMTEIIEKLFGKQPKRVTPKDLKNVINFDNSELNELLKENENLMNTNKYLNDIVSGYEHIMYTYLNKEILDSIKNRILHDDNIDNDKKILLLKILSVRSI